ncbi:hypothetical protein VIGAN_05122600 [Vigna angularis var. angularis]|uniref:Uncharacterized protein n=1 Tax=Vigna angularis var. angularis TaxID=157739 RepID=A0A0S3S4Q0_PHAAN|nr:hypothetical protein VIGAN_05122600 [Vigna angularis var. angularis]
MNFTPDVLFQLSYESPEEKEKKNQREEKVQSEGADAEGGVAIGESETGVDLREFAATEEAIVDGQLSVVLDGALIGRRGILVAAWDHFLTEVDEVPLEQALEGDDVAV